MLKSSEFNSAVPKFTNGNYANNPLDPTNIEEPTMQDYVRGVEPLETLPAQWWNWLCNQFTSRFNKLNTYVKNIFDELTQLLSLVNVTPDGTESSITTGQLKNAFKELYPTYVSNKLELGTTYVKRTQKVNNHALTGDVTVTKSDVGLGSVVNTGDSANASSGGTTKFTTGGAYNLLSSIAPYFSTSTAYAVGALITYQNRLYECTTAHSAGAWNASHFTARSVQYVINNYILPSLAPAFSTSTSYAVGTFVTYQNKLYRCKATHSAGAWNTSHFELANINNVTVDTDGKLALKADLLDLAPAFSTSTSYAVGDYVTYNGNLYRCTIAHSGAWNASGFTLVTVGSDLALKADKTSLSLPTDAVLHYSFDEVPDIPDGTADIRREYGETYRNSTEYCYGNTTQTISNVNGNFHCISTVRYGGVYLRNDVASSKIATVRVKVIKGTVSIGLLSNVKGVGTWVVSRYVTSSFYIASATDEETEWELEYVYIGNGSYITPVIDNANGQNNATNNGGVAVNGVSGKGVYLANGKYISTSNFNLSTDFSVSIWVKPDNSTSGLNGEIIRSIGQFVIRNGDTDNSVFGVIIWTSETLTYKSIGRLLSEGVWTHIVVTRSGTSMKLYLNGILTNTWTLNSENLQPATQSYSLGSSINTRPQSFDDLLIFDRALTEDEVTALYLNKANTPKYYGEVPVTRKVNGHTLEEDIALTKADVGLGDVANKDLSNVVNTGDSATPVSGGTTKFTTGGAYTELAKKVDKTTTVNGHALSGNVTVTKSDVGLGNVVNTGDSNSPALNGTDKFTTGGAYNLLLNLAPAFSTSTAYTVNQLVTYNGTLYKCTTAHSAGAWNTSHFTAVTLNDIAGVTGVKGNNETAYRKGNVNITKTNVGLGNVADTGDSATPVSDGTTKFTTGGAYNLLTSLAPIFSTSTSYAVGDIVTYSGKLYTCTTAHSAGTWNASHFTVSNLNNFYNFTNGEHNSKIWTSRLLRDSLCKNWVSSTGLPTSSNSSDKINCIYYANGVWVALVSIGSTTLTYESWWSTDGATWTQGTGITHSIIEDVYFANNIWVAVGYDGMAWSTDGKSWTEVLKTNANIYNVLFANGIWVAVQRSGSPWWSTDGKNWTHSASTITFAPNNKGRCLWNAMGTWVIFSKDIYTSSDGKTWTQRTTDNEIIFGCYGNGEWLAINNSKIYKSTDGTTWNSVTNSSNITGHITFGDGLYVCGKTTTSSTEHLVYSQDGIHWNDIVGETDINKIYIEKHFYDNGVWVFVSNSGYIAVSYDGVTWIKTYPQSVRSLVVSTSAPYYSVCAHEGTWVIGGGKLKIYKSSLDTAHL